MKKLVIATAIAMAAMTVQAQDVKVFGVLDVSEYHFDKKDAKNYTNFNSKTASTSRFGISASEDLGDGLRAGAALETELNMATGATGSTSSGTAAGTYNRAANVFLASKDLGTLTVGRQVTPVYAATSVGDALGVNSLGFINAVVAAHANTNAITGEARAAVAGVTETSPGLFNAGVAYTSPKFAGFSVSAFTTPNSGTQGATVSDAGQRDVIVNFGAGALNVAVGQSKTFTATGDDLSTKNLFAANYTIGALKVTGGLHQTRFDAYHDIDIKSAGARYQINPRISVGASYTTAEDKTTTANKNTTYGVAGFYDFSKRTQAYAMAGQSKNEGASFLNPVYGGATLTAASDGNAYAVGLKHSF